MIVLKAMNILIYGGKGTSKANVVQSSVIAALKFFGVFDQYKVSTVQAKCFYDRDWLSSTKLLTLFVCSPTKIMSPFLRVPF